MSVSHEQFTSWLQDIVAERADQVVNVRRVGIRHPNILYVGRAMHSGPFESGTWGNPYNEFEHGRDGAIYRYVARLHRMTEFERIAFLRPIYDALQAGKKLACWCAPEPCHAHVLAAWADRYAEAQYYPNAVTLTAMMATEEAKRSPQSAFSTAQ